MTIEEKTKEITNREVKSSAFTTLFSDPKNAALLYKALENGEEISPEDIDYTTLSGVLFMARKNDMAFTVRKKVLVISEHQSTINANMPLRDAIYYGRTMEKLIEPRALYRTRLISIPLPEFFVFYNGNEPYPKETVLKLSDAYLEKADDPMLQLKVKVVNINLAEDHPILKACRPMYEYSWFINRIKTRIGDGESRDTAITKAIQDAEEEGILTEFLREHGTEVSNMLFTEFNMEDALAVRGEEKFAEGMEKGREAGKVEGKAEGKAESILELLELLGTIPETVKETVKAEQNLQTLTKWLKAAAAAESIGEFERTLSE